MSLLSGLSAYAETFKKRFKSAHSFPSRSPLKALISALLDTDFRNSR